MEAGGGQGRIYGLNRNSSIFSLSLLLLLLLDARSASDDDVAISCQVHIVALLHSPANCSHCCPIPVVQSR